MGMAEEAIIITDMEITEMAITITVSFNCIRTKEKRCENAPNMGRCIVEHFYSLKMHHCSFHRETFQ